jgi:hypothetical protein
MTRKLKILGLLAVALALSGLGASSAQAANFFHNHIGEQNPDQVILTGTNVTTDGTVHPQVFTPAPASKAIVCKEVTLKGTGDTEGRVKDEEKDENEKPLPWTHENATTKVKTITSTSITATPAYSGCEVAGVGEATVTNSGCHFRFTAETDAEGHAGGHLECGTTGSLVVKTKTCEVVFKSQTVGKGARYENTGETGKGRDVTVESTATGIAFTTNKNLVCLAAGIPNEGKEGTYSGKVTVRAFEDKNNAEDARKTGVYNEGKQLDAWWGPTI